MCELLCPAGSPKALEAAIEGGADAVYFGGVGFNARRNAPNFTEEEMRASIALAHTHGVRVYITQNTLIFDREKKDYLSAAESALRAGADALIVADIGGAMEIKRHFPDAVLHASTQMSGHSVEAAKALAALGFSRMVCAREMSLGDLATFCEKSPIEAEVFVHGALCVCHSGQCLFSSVVGGRSGNRGECAQPCRLPYGNSYPLSLKDLALAAHIPTIKELGIASLKIEGRMKSPEYVRDVAAIYRRLLDENRAASGEEMQELAAIFSRGGFTDGYFTKKIGRGMLGVRSEANKETSRALEPFRAVTKKRPVTMTAEILRGKPAHLTLTCGEVVGEATGEIPVPALTAPLSREAVTKNLLKLGATPFTASSLTLTLDEGLMLPLSALNALRRDAVASLTEKLTATKPLVKETPAPLSPVNPKKKTRSAFFRTPEQIPACAKDFFDLIFLPLDRYDGSVEGVALPPVIFDSERDKVKTLLGEAVSRGAHHALIGNIGHLTLATDMGLIPHGNIGLNITNSASAAVVESLGFADCILSPELSLPRLRDVDGATLALVYGRIPLMTLEKCIGRELGGCKTCESDRLALTDRRGISFPVRKEWERRSVIYNSLPTAMPEKMRELRAAGIVGEYFLFSTESVGECAAVIDAYQKQVPLPFAVRRLPK
ncbi:MAG: U32 family peptidase [Ruminococcaceae bacterium]|nr:U32 family peptidase [Oscillospiraceae bacterium]